MKLAFTLAVTALLALTTTQADATLVITYDGSNRPTSVSGLSVSVAPFLVDIIIDFSGNSFNDQFGVDLTPPGPPGGLTWLNAPLASAVAASLTMEMSADLTPDPIVDAIIYFPVSATATAFALSGILSEVGLFSWFAFPGAEFRSTTGAVVTGWATVSAVPEPSAFWCVGLVGLGFAVWKRRTAKRDPS